MYRKKKLIKRPGRPKGSIKTKSDPARKFFELADDLGLGLGEVLGILKGKVKNPPSYRTLQEWRRGTHTPRFVPFEAWEGILRSASLL